MGKRFKGLITDRLDDMEEENVGLHRMHGGPLGLRGITLQRCHAWGVPVAGVLLRP